MFQTYPSSPSLPPHPDLLLFLFSASVTILILHPVVKPGILLDSSQCIQHTTMPWHPPHTRPPLPTATLGLGHPLLPTISLLLLVSASAASAYTPALANPSCTLQPERSAQRVNMVAWYPFFNSSDPHSPQDKVQISPQAIQGSPPPSPLYFSPVQSLSHVRLFATPWTTAHQSSLSITNSWSLLKLTSIKLVMPSNHLILFRPLLFLPSIFPSIRVFSSEVGSLHHVGKVLELQHQSFQWIFRTDLL